MLYPTSGSRLFIASNGGWIEIGETESIGFLGLEWDMVYDGVLSCDDEITEVSVKGALRRPEMSVVMGNDPTDPGQAMLWTAARSRDAYDFRLLFSDQVTERRWSALVIRMGEAFDAANSLMRLQADLKPTKQVYPGEA